MFFHDRNSRFRLFSFGRMDDDTSNESGYVQIMELHFDIS